MQGLRDLGSIPGQGTKIPHITGQLRDMALTIGIGFSKNAFPKTLCLLTKPRYAMGQLNPRTTQENLIASIRESPHATAKTQNSQNLKKQINKL